MLLHFMFKYMYMVLRILICSFMACRKKCVHSYNVFDFLKEVVSKVPDYGQSDTAADTSKRRLVIFICYFVFFSNLPVVNG